MTEAGARAQSPGMRRALVPLLLLSLAALPSCAKPARATLVATSHPADQALDIAVRTLAQHGFTAARIDESAGVVATDWQATHFMYGEGPTGRTAYVVRRMMVTVAPSSAGAEVRVTLEDMSCEDPGMIRGDGAEHAGCAMIDGIVPPDQEKLDQVGADLRRALRSSDA